MPISDQLLAILACPQTHAPVVLDGEWIVSTDPATRRRYPIKDEIPVMLIEESEEMPDNAWREVMQRHQVSVNS
jgi:uncharacterized protein YbaR (Trm112 family)